MFYLPLVSERSAAPVPAALRPGAGTVCEGKVTVVDSTFVCYPVVYMLKAAREMLEKGYTCAQIKEKIEKEGELFAILIPENLNALKNGGRISPAAAALAGMLKIHPLLKVETRRDRCAGQGAHGCQHAYQCRHRVRRSKDVDPDDYDWMIIHADNDKVLRSAAARSCRRRAGIRSTAECSVPVIMAHTGEGTIGFGRIRKPEILIRSVKLLEDQAAFLVLSCACVRIGETGMNHQLARSYSEVKEASQDGKPQAHHHVCPGLCGGIFAVLLCAVSRPLDVEAALPHSSARCICNQVGIYEESGQCAKDLRAAGRSNG